MILFKRMYSKGVKERESDRIKKLVAMEYRVSVNEINSASQKSPLMEARQMAMYVTRGHTYLSLQKIGAEYKGRSISGNKDHSTVKYSINKITDLMDVDPEVKRKHDNIIKRL